MTNLEKIRVIERIMFVALLIAIGLAGFMYEIYRETVEAVILVPILIGYLLVCYVVYRGLKGFVTQVITRRD